MGDHEQLAESAFDLVLPEPQDEPHVIAPAAP